MTTQSVTTQSVNRILRHTLSEYFVVLENIDKIERLYDTVIKDVERLLIDKVMKITNFNKSRSARILGISRNTLNAKLRTLKLKYKF